MIDVDFRKLINQDADFQTFCKEVLYGAMIKGNEDFIKSIHSFYQIGMTIDQVVKFMINQMRMNQ